MTVQTKLITRTQIDDISSFLFVPKKKNARKFATMIKKYAIMCQIIMALFTIT